MSGRGADPAGPGAEALEVEVLSGARRGFRMRLEHGPVLVGRAPEAGLRFDPTGDLEVSSRHARFVHQHGAWWVQDLDSRNGTFIGGERIGADHRLRDGERIRFGPSGPEVAVRTTSSATRPAAAVGGPSRSTGETPSGTVRRLARQNRRLRIGIAAAAVMVVAAGAGAAVSWHQSRRAWDSERAALLARSDSLLQRSRSAVQALEGELGGLRAALESSREQVTGLRAAVQSAETRDADAPGLEDLRDRLQAAEVALTRQQLAATLDFAEIERRNRRALAMLFVELEPGSVSTATAFGVLPDGTLATSRHAVLGPGGGMPSRIGVQFADSRQVWRGRVVAVSEDWDLALVKVDDVVGATPVVHGTNARIDTLASGTPVALLGFPLAERADAPRPLVSAGVVRAWGPGEVRIQGYGAEGASGSPVLDARGSLVAILYGGTGAGPDRELVAVPAAGLESLLASVRAGATASAGLRRP